MHDVVATTIVISIVVICGCFCCCCCCCCCCCFANNVAFCCLSLAISDFTHIMCTLLIINKYISQTVTVCTASD